MMTPVEEQYQSPEFLRHYHQQCLENLEKNINGLKKFHKEELKRKFSDKMRHQVALEVIDDLMKHSGLDVYYLNLKKYNKKV